MIKNFQKCLWIYWLVIILWPSTLSVFILDIHKTITFNELKENNKRHHVFTFHFKEKQWNQIKLQDGREFKYLDKYFDVVNVEKIGTTYKIMAQSDRIEDEMVNLSHKHSNKKISTTLFLPVNHGQIGYSHPIVPSWKFHFIYSSDSIYDFHYQIDIPPKNNNLVPFFTLPNMAS